MSLEALRDRNDATLKRAGVCSYFALVPKYSYCRLYCTLYSLINGAMGVWEEERNAVLSFRWTPRPVIVTIVAIVAIISGSSLEEGVT